MQSPTLRGLSASTAPHGMDKATSDHAVRPDVSANSDRLMEKLATTVSSRDDDYLKGSDSWRLHSDASTMSSRVTTPDPQPPPRSRPPLSSTTTETRTPHVSRTPAIPIPGALPPPPLPPPPRHPLLPSFNQSPQVTQPPQNFVPEPNHGSNDSVPILSQTFPFANGYHYAQNSAPPTHGFAPSLLPRTGQLSSIQHIPDSPQLIQRNPNSQPPGIANGLYQRGPTPSTVEYTRSAVQAQNPRYHAHNLNKTLAFVPSPVSNGKGSSTSQYTSEEDTFAYRNARQFPPQFPAQLSTHFSTRRSRSSATNRITNWVSQYEKSLSHGGTRRQEPATPSASEHPESDSTKSSSSAASSHAAVEHLWQLLKQKRHKLHEIREQMSRQRQELRDLRRRKDEADNAFMMVIRPLLVSQRSDVFLSSLKLLDSRMAAMLKLREEYHFNEASYESMELDLDVEENELSGLETKFFSLLATGHDKDTEQFQPARKKTTDTTASADDKIPYDLIGISADKQLEDVHPFYLAFAAAVGDLENAKEEYDDLMFVNSQYEDDRDLRHGTGRSITADAEEFFAELPDERARMQGTIDELEHETKRLRRLCEETGTMKKFLSIHMSYVLNPDMAYEDMDLEDTRDILEKPKTTAHPRYFELLAQHSHLLDGPKPLTAKQAMMAASRLPNDDPVKVQKQQFAAKEYAIEALVQGQNSNSKNEFVNRWILQQLRQSPLHVLLLQSIFGSECKLKIRDLWRWQCDVLHYWWRDDTVTLDENMTRRCISEMSEYSERQGTPQHSRAASDSGLHVKPKRQYLRHYKSSDMLRFM